MVVLKSSFLDLIFSVLLKFSVFGWLETEFRGVTILMCALGTALLVVIFHKTSSSVGISV